MRYSRAITNNMNLNKKSEELRDKKLTQDRYNYQINKP